MVATAQRLDDSDALIDINSASSDELCNLPGIGAVLANRIVAYRDQHGPFEDMRQLSLVPGLSERRVSKFAPRLSMRPANSDGRLESLTLSFLDQIEGDPITPSPIVSVPALDPWKEPIAPSMSSLFSPSPQIEEERHDASAAHDASTSRDSSVGFGDTERFFWATPPPLPEPPPMWPETLAPAAPSARPQDQATESAAPVEEPALIPMFRPRHAWSMLAAFSFFSAMAGSLWGARSQGGGMPHAQLERQVGHMQADVADINVAVKGLEKQATTWSSSISALDARLVEQEHLSAQLAAPLSALDERLSRQENRTRELAAQAREVSEKQEKAASAAGSDAKQAKKTLRQVLEQFDSRVAARTRGER